MSVFETALEKIARLIADRWGINVIFEGDSVKTDGKTITLPAITDDMTPEQIEDLNAYLDNQVAHCKFTDFEDYRPYEGDGQAFHEQLLKVAEEHRVEQKLIELFPGCKHNMAMLKAKIRDKLATEWDKLPYPAKLIITAQDQLEGREGQLEEDLQGMYKLIEDRVEQVRECKTTKEVRELTAEMTREYVQLGDKLAQPINQPAPSEDGEQGEPCEGGEGEKGKKGKGKGKGLLDKLFGDGEEFSPGDTQMTMSDVMGEGDGQPQDGEFKDKKQKARRGRPMPGRFNGGTAIEYDKNQGKRLHIAASTRFDTEEDLTGQGDKTKYLHLKKEVSRHVAPIRRTLEKALKVAEDVRWRQERERGMINTRTLAKLVAEPGYRKPFKQQTREEVNNVAVEFLVDMSGSMGGNKIRLAKATVIALGEALKGLDIPFEVTGFYSGMTGCDKLRRHLEANPHLQDYDKYNRISETLNHFVFKRFDSVDLSGIEKMHSGGNNTDGESVRWAARRLSKQKQKRKILFVLSDGYPAAEGDNNILFHDLKSAVQEISKHGIEVVGLGIMSTSVEQFYPDHVVVNHLEELPKAAMTKLSKLILKNMRLR